MVDPAKGAQLLRILKENFAYRALFARYAPALEKRNQLWDGHEYHGPAIEPEKSFEQYKSGPEPEAGMFFAKVMSLRIIYSVRFCRDPFWIRRGDRPALTSEESMLFLDPAASIESIPADRRDFVLSRMFHWTVVSSLPLDNRYDWDWGRIMRTLCGQPKAALQPRERVLLVDTSASRAQLLREFDAFLRDAGSPDEAREWQTEKQLEVWHLRKHRGMTFTGIAKELGITEVDARKAFIAAHEKTQGYPYRGGKASTRPVFELSEALVCLECDKREGCTELCEDAERFADQGRRGERHGVVHPDMDKLPSDLDASLFPRPEEIGGFIELSEDDEQDHDSDYEPEWEPET